MFRQIILATTFAATILSGSLLAASTPSSAPSLDRMPLAFTKNNGQWDSQVLFRTSSGGAMIWICKDRVVYQFVRRIEAPGVGANSSAHSPKGRNMFPPAAGRSNEFDPAVSEPDSVEQLVISAKFVDANPNPDVIPEGRMEYKCNYFIGNDPAKWHTDVPNYEAVTLKSLYPGVDLKLSSDANNQATYEFIAASTADLSAFRVTYDGVESTSLDSDGRVVLSTKWGSVIATLGSNTESKGSATPGFEIDGFNSYKVASARQSVTLSDPKKIGLVYSTYLGHTNNEGFDWGTAIAVDRYGCAYVTGAAGSQSFPTQNPFQQCFGGGTYDVFVTKFNSTGTGLIYSTFLGGNADMAGDDMGNGIAVDSDGSACVTGITSSLNFPTYNAFQANKVRAADAFVTRLSREGNGLTFSTYLGGSLYDRGWAIAVDSFDNVYVTGESNSPDFPTLNPIQTGTGAFIAKFIGNGTLLYCTCLTASSGRGIAVDSDGNVCITGSASATFATVNPIQTFQGASDAFVSMLSNSGSSLVFSTFLGGAGADAGYGISLDAEGSIYVLGQTRSSDFPTLNPIQGYQGMTDMFVTKLDNAGTHLEYSTYLGGSGEEGGRTPEYFKGGIAIDPSGNAWIVAATASVDFPTANSLMPYCGGGDGEDVFVSKLNSSGDTLLFGTFLCGDDEQEGSGIAVDASGGVCLTGWTSSSDFPTLNAYQAPISGSGHYAFVTKLAECPCIDPNGDGAIDISDQVYLIAYVFCGGPKPMPFVTGDINRDLVIDVSDIVYLGEVIFRGLAPLCSNCD
jgi:hypothetical protein